MLNQPKIHTTILSTDGESWFVEERSGTTRRVLTIEGSELKGQLMYRGMLEHDYYMYQQWVEIWASILPLSIVPGESQRKILLEQDNKVYIPRKKPAKS